MFERGDSRKPIIIGLMPNSEKNVETVVDDKTTVISSEKEILIRCGEASIHLKKDGKIGVFCPGPEGIMTSKAE